jgi:hypothetical protein
MESRYSTLLEEFAKKTDCGEWPISTNVHCHWCCHAFNTSPVSLPFRIHMRDDATIQKCEVQGCFCSFQCAAAFNFESNSDIDDVWEKYAMLNRLYYDYMNNLGEEDPMGRIIPAPSRFTLQMFGGYLSIDEFRAKSMPKTMLQRNGESSVQGGTFVDVLRTPMSFVPQQVEEINEADVSRPLKFIPVDQDRINKVREKIILKRSKPLVNSKHTLDHIMNLRITPGADHEEKA